MQDIVDQKALLTTAQAARRLGWSESAINKARVTGLNSPPYVKIGRSVRYRPEDLDHFIAERVMTSTSQQAA
ncbi:MAG: helix-turn-helix domain-containing protein [Alphaproteobacteria bacterium]|nr:helix-turn-helix domain-containing protein [Alphaproteobacteria bacterium]